MNLINFGKGSLDFLKDLRKRDITMFLAFLLVCTLLLKDEIKELLTQEPKQEQTQTDIFSQGIEDAMELEYILNDIVETYDVDYINVNLFHNGTVSASGYHFKKMSCIAEGKKLGNLPRIHKLQNWVIDPFKEKIAETKKVGYVYLPNLPEDKDPYFNTTIPKYNIYSVFYVGLFDHRKRDAKGRPHFIGFISFGWEKPTNFDDNTLVSMMKERERISEFIIK